MRSTQQSRGARGEGSALIIRFAMIAILAFTATSCSVTGPESKSMPLRVAIDKWPGYYPLIIAQDRGLFEARNLDLEIAIPEDTDRMIAEFAAHSHDIVAVALGDIIPAAALNPQIRVFLVSDESNGGDAIVGTTPLESPDAIRGKRISTNLGGFGEVFVRVWLKESGLRPGDITLVNVESADVPDGLAGGVIDAGHCWEPYVSRAVENGAHIWYSSKDTPGLIPDVLATHADVIEFRADDMKKFVDAWFEALDWWLANPAEGNSLIEASLDLEPGSVSLKGIRLLSREENLNYFDIAEDMSSLHHVTDIYSDFFIASGALGRRVSPSTLLCQSCLD